VKKVVSLLLPLIGVAIFAWILRGIGLATLVDIFRRVEPERLIIFPVFAVFSLWIRGLRWRHIMRMIDIEYPLHRSMMIWAVGFAAASITPGKVGDAMRAYYLSKDTERNLGECFLTVFIDRLLDLMTVLIAGAITVLLFSYYYTDLPNVWVVVVAVIGIIGVLYVGMHRKLVRKLFRPLFNLVAPDRYKKELSGHFNSFYESLGLYLRNPIRTSIAMGYTLVFWVSVVFLAYAVTWILEIEVSLKFIALMLPMLTLAEVLPISIGGLGTRDAAAIYLFSVVGVASAPAVGFSLLYVLGGTYFIAAIGFIAWLFKPAKFRTAVEDRP
jgi:uncharacterized protein (TIRG00374 family)